MSGPAPKPADQRRRRNVTPGFRQLPAEGRAGDPPPFPLDDPSEAELQVWAELWALPQAVEWERLSYVRIVGRYVRMIIDAEEHEAKVAMLAEIRQLEDRLGLSPRSLTALRWEIADPIEPKRDPALRAVPSQPYVPKTKTEG